MKKVLFVLILLSCVTVISAQEQTPKKAVSRFGVKTSLNLSGVRYLSSDFQQLVGSDLERLPNGAFGIYGESGSDYFVTQIGLQYFGKGFSTGDNSTTRFHAVQVPLMLNFRLPIVHGLGVQMGLGGYGGISFLARENADDIINEDILSFKRNIENNNDSDVKMYNPWDFGLSFGGCVEYEYMDGKIVELGFQYDLGLWEVSNEYAYIDGADPFNPGMKNDAFVISLAFLFDKTKPALKPLEE